MKYFLAETLSFHDDKIAPVPEGAVEITDDEHAAVFAEHAKGFPISAGPDGKPVANPTS